MPSPGKIPDIVSIVDRSGNISRQWIQWFTTLKEAIAPSPLSSSRAFYLPNTSGAPTFTPEVRGGFSPAVYDPSANKLYVHNGTAWKSVTLS